MGTTKQLEMVFKREDLLFGDCYDWKPEEECRNFSVPDTNPSGFDKRDGMTILNFINHFCINYNASTCTTNSCHKLEILIKETPEELVDPYLIAKWILLTWDIY